MKIQDIGFLIIFLAVLWTKNSRLTTLIGLFCLVLAIPLFSLWIFFTAQRLVIYAAAFFTLSIIWQISQIKQRGKEEKRRDSPPQAGSGIATFAKAK